MTKDQPGRFSRAKTQASGRWSALKAAHPSVRHTVAAWGRMQDNNANQYAGAITYFSFLALFPLLLLAVAITGFVLHSHPAAQASLFDHITSNVPGSVGTTLSSSVKTAIKARTGVGIVGLVGVLLTGLGWIGNLRAAIDAVWGRRPPKVNFVKGKLANLVVLGGLGLGIIVSLGLTVVGTALTDQILKALSLDDLPGVHWLVKVLGVLLALAGDLLIFWWLLVRLPGAAVPARLGLRGALLAAVGFEVLKIVGTFTIAKSAGSPTAGPFAGLLAVLIWIQLVARYLLFCAAWLAVLTAEQSGATATDVIDTAQPAEGPDTPEPSPALSPAVVGATLLGTGAVAGAVATWALTRPDARRVHSD